jgi:hypothetical protein
MDEQSFLEERRQRAVDIGGLGKPPQFLDETRGRGRRREEARHDAEAAGDFVLKSGSAAYQIIGERSRSHDCGRESIGNGYPRWGNGPGPAILVNWWLGGRPSE